MTCLCFASFAMWVKKVGELLSQSCTQLHKLQPRRINNHDFVFERLHISEKHMVSQCFLCSSIYKRSAHMPRHRSTSRHWQRGHRSDSRGRRQRFEDERGHKHAGRYHRSHYRHTSSRRASRQQHKKHHKHRHENRSTCVIKRLGAERDKAIQALCKQRGSFLLSCVHVIAFAVTNESIRNFNCHVAHVLHCVTAHLLRMMASQSHLVNVSCGALPCTRTIQFVQ